LHPLGMCQPSQHGMSSKQANQAVLQELPAFMAAVCTQCMAASARSAAVREVLVPTSSRSLLVVAVDLVGPRGPVTKEVVMHGKGCQHRAIPADVLLHYGTDKCAALGTSSSSGPVSTSVQGANAPQPACIMWRGKNVCACHAKTTSTIVEWGHSFLRVRVHSAWQHDKPRSTAQHVAVQYLALAGTEW
jgi:hypothetical protein